jgi:hypothetical protein
MLSSMVFVAMLPDSRPVRAAAVESCGDAQAASRLQGWLWWSAA